MGTHSQLSIEIHGYKRLKYDGIVKCFLNLSEGHSVPCDIDKIQGHTESASIYDTLR